MDQAYPNHGLMSWMERADEDAFLSASCHLRSFRYGVERLSAGRRRNRLEQW